MMDTFVWTAFCISCFLLGAGIGGIIEYRRRNNALDKFEEAQFRLQMALSHLSIMHEKVDLIGRYETREEEYEEEYEDLAITSEMKILR